MAKVQADFNAKQLSRNLQNFDKNVRGSVAAVVDYNAGYGEAWLKANARWTDRTGAARTGLTAISSRDRQAFYILMAYAVNYGIWLEIAHDRKYAIITPGMRIIGDKLMKDLQMLLNRIEYNK